MVTTSFDQNNYAVMVVVARLLFWRLFVFAHWLHAVFSLHRAAGGKEPAQMTGGVPNLRERHGRLSVACVESLPPNRLQRKKIFLTDCACLSVV